MGNVIISKVGQRLKNIEAKQKEFEQDIIGGLSDEKKTTDEGLDSQKPKRQYVRKNQLVKDEVENNSIVDTEE